MKLPEFIQDKIDKNPDLLQSKFSFLSFYIAFELPDYFLDQYCQYLRWDLLSLTRQFTEQELRKYMDKIHIRNVFGNHYVQATISEEFLTEFASQIDWYQLLTTNIRKYSEDFYIINMPYIKKSFEETGVISYSDIDIVDCFDFLKAQNLSSRVLDTYQMLVLLE